MEINLLLIIVSLIMLFISVFAIKFWKLFNEGEKVFGVFIIGSTLFEIFAIVSNLYFYIANNLFGMHLYTLFSFVCLTVFFKKIYKYFGVNIYGNYLLIMGVSLIVLNSIFIQPITQFNSFSKTGTDVYILVLAVGFFILKIKNTKELTRKSIIYFVSAIFFNSCITSVIYLFSNQIIELAKSQAVSLWAIVVTVNLITQIIIFIGVIQIIKNRKMEQLIMQEF